LCAFNVTVVAKFAGISERKALPKESRLLTNVNIENYIHSRTSASLEELGVTKERILREYVSLAFGKFSDYLEDNLRLKPLSEISTEKRGLVNLKVYENFKTGEKSISISLNLNVKIKALEFLLELVKDK